MESFVVGVLALQGGFLEHISMLQKAAERLSSAALAGSSRSHLKFEFIEVRNKEDLSRCHALVIPGGESTSISFVAAQIGLLEPLRDFVKVDRKPVWGTCAGIVLLADEVVATKKGGQELIGGLGVRVHRNAYGRQINSFAADLDLPFLEETESSPKPPAPFPGIFIRAPVVDGAPARCDSQVESADARRGPVEVLGTLRRQSTAKPTVEPGSAAPEGNAEKPAEDVIAVRQDNIFGTTFHPELSGDIRIHLWWLQQLAQSVKA